MVFKSGETNIICTNLEKSLVFYQDILGFIFVEEEQGAVRLVLSGRYYLLLPFASQTRPTWEYCSAPDISFDLLVDDLEQAFHYLKAHRVKFAQKWSANESNFLIYDPDRLIIEIVEAAIATQYKDQ
ncbi:MAG: catechol 2,3-dioxygenase-like lactoylglutathione lyase family enzyme [Cellvibrionaceae bacterium]